MQSDKKKPTTPKIIRQTGHLLQEIEKRQNENPNEDSLTSFIKTMEDKPETVEHIPDAMEQVDALKKFQSGGMSYAEMRMHCG